MSTQTLASAVRATILAGVLGMVAFADLNNAIATGINSAPQAYQVSTITVAGSPTNSHDFTVGINGISVTYTSDGSATSQEVVDGLTEAINASPGVRAAVSAVATSSTVITLTAVVPGQSFTLTESDGDLSTATTTSAASADDIAFGRLVMASSYDSDLKVPSVFLPKSTYLTAQVDSWAITYDASVDITVTMTIGGVTYAATVNQATSLDASLDALAAEINAIMPANTILAASTPSTATALTLTAEVPGTPFTSSVRFGAGRDTGAAVLTRTAPLTSDVTKAMKGIAVLGTDNAATTIGGGTTGYAANGGVNYLASGCVWVASTESVTPADDVYVETSGASAGLFYTTSTSTRIKLTNCRWGRAQAADGIAQLYINA